jgi:hypothetical protein
MKFSIATELLLIYTQGASAFYAYSEFGDLGPSNWASLLSDGNECGGTNGDSGFGQSPVTISEDTVEKCDTNMEAYEFVGGSCTWGELDFIIGNNGKINLLC